MDIKINSSVNPDISKPHHLTNFEAIQVFYERSKFHTFGTFDFSFLNYFAKTRLLTIQDDAMEEAHKILENYPFTVEEKVQILNFFPITVEELIPLVKDASQRFSMDVLEKVTNSLSKLYSQDAEDEEEETES